MTDFTVEVASPPSYAVAPGDDGEYVVTMAEGATYEVAVSGGATTLGGLTDVDTTGVADGDALVYDDATDTWVPGQAGAVDSVNGETGAVVLDAADVPYTGSGYTAVGIPTEPDDVQEALDDLIAVLSPVALGFIGHVGATDPHGDRAYADGLVDDLSGVTNAAQARTNLGLGSAATHASGDFDTAGAASAAQTAAQSYADALVDDLSGVTNAATARTNLGLGSAATYAASAFDTAGAAAAAQAYAVQRGNHTGTQLAATISDFATSAVSACTGTFVPLTRTVSTGTGLTGGGDLSADRTLSLSAIADKTFLGNVSGSSAAPTATSAANVLGALSAAASAAFDWNAQDVKNAARLAVNASAWSTVEKLRVNTPTTADTAANVMASASASTAKPLVLQAAASQSAVLFATQDSTGSQLTSMNTSGFVITTGGFQVGTNPAASGVLRMPNNTGIYARNAANSADLMVAKIDNSNYLTLGDSTGAIFMNVPVRVNSGSGTLGTVEKFRVTTPTTADNTANVMLGASAATSKPLVLQMAASPSANPFDVQGSTGSSKFTVNTFGQITQINGNGVSWGNDVLQLNNPGAEVQLRSMGSTANSHLVLSGAAVSSSIVKIRPKSGGSDVATYSTSTITWSDAINLAVGTATGTKIGTATSQKLGLWNATPIVQPTTAVAAATFVANTSGIANDTATWDGYTIGQVVKALRNMGALA